MLDKTNVFNSFSNLSIINDLEKKLGKIVLSSNQTLIWDALNQIDYKNKIEGYGELFKN